MKKFTQWMSLIFVAVFFLTSVNSYSQTNILVVDRDGSFYSTSFTDCWPYYQEALDQLNVTYTVFEVEDAAADGPDASTMANYDMVIFFTGEVWDGGATMTDNDEFNLVLYTNVSGGKVFLSAQDYLWDRYAGATSFGSGSVPYDVFGLSGVEQDWWFIGDPDIHTAFGCPGSLANGFQFDVHDIFTEVTDEGLYADWFQSYLGEPLFNMTVDGIDSCSAIQYDAGNFRTVFSTLSFASVITIPDRVYLMDHIIAFLMGTTGIENTSMEISSELLVYPNPATDMVRIGTDTKMKEISILNSQGQVVYTQEMDSNILEFNTQSLQTGIYFVRAQTEKGIITSRMVVN
ncbi:T9SS type A sorting domain-containing protein [Bacteroidota bacterium]